MPVNPGYRFLSDPKNEQLQPAVRFLDYLNRQQPTPVPTPVPTRQPTPVPTPAPTPTEAPVNLGMGATPYIPTGLSDADIQAVNAYRGSQQPVRQPAHQPMPQEPGQRATPYIPTGLQDSDMEAINSYRQSLKPVQQPVEMPANLGGQVNVPPAASLPVRPMEQMPSASVTMERQVPDRFEQTTMAQMGQKAGWDPRALYAAMAQFSGEFGNLGGKATSSSAQPYYEQMMDTEQKAQAAAQKAREAALDRAQREKEMEMRYAPKTVGPESELKMELVRAQTDSLKNKMRVDQEMNDPESERSKALKFGLEKYVQKTMNIPQFKAHPALTGSDVYKWLGSMQYAMGQQNMMTREQLDAISAGESKAADQNWREQEAEKQRKFQAEQNALNRGAAQQRQQASIAARPVKAAPVAKPGDTTGAEKPLTADERRRQQQVLQMEQSQKNLDALSSKRDFTSMKYLGQMNLPTGLKFGEWQEYENEAKRFVENILRLRTGAAVSAQEQDSQFQQMFPMPGDTAPEIDRKRKYRQSIIDEVRAAGRLEPTATPSTAPAKKVKSIKDIIGG